MRIILASGSPRRKALMELLGVRFIVAPARISERLPKTLRVSISEYAVELAVRKAKAVQKKYPRDLILGADTIVVLGNKIMGKPTDSKKAVAMLEQLSGKTHRVITGVALLCRGKARTGSCETQVTFRKLSTKFIRKYVGTGEPMDKAGAYGIQGLGALCVSRIEGDYLNVVGLPLVKVFGLCDQMGLRGTHSVCSKGILFPG